MVWRRNGRSADQSGTVKAKTSAPTNAKIFSLNLGRGIDGDGNSGGTADKLNAERTVSSNAA